MLKEAKMVCMGDVIVVNLGKGLVEKIVDRTQYDDVKKIVKITLFSSSGRRPQLMVSEDSLIEVKDMS